MTLEFQLNPKLENIQTHLGHEPPTIDVAGNVDGDWDERKTNKEGYVAYLNVPAQQQHVLIRAAGYEDVAFPVEMPQPGLLTVLLKRLPMARLVSIDLNSHRMVNERGERVYGRGASFFLGFKKHLDGRDINGPLDQLAGLGCNLVRLMGMFESLGGFDPRPYGDRYYSEIPVFMDRLAQRGIYGLWTACAATGGIFNADQAMQHIHRTVEALLTTRNAIFSPVNEQGQHNNSIDRDRFKRELMDTGKLGWMIYDTGSFGGDLPVQPPFGMYAPFHVRRDYPSSVKDCGIIDHTNRVNDHLEIGVDEPYRMGDEGSGDRHDDPIVAREAAGIAYNALYFVAHSMSGERADLLTGNTLECVSAAMDAMKGH